MGAVVHEVDEVRSMEASVTEVHQGFCVSETVDLPRGLSDHNVQFLLACLVILSAPNEPKHPHVRQKVNMARRSSVW